MALLSFHLFHAWFAAWLILLGVVALYLGLSWFLGFSFFALGSGEEYEPLSSESTRDHEMEH
jgi:hypothetical protein